jgi:MFS transporter, ACS family, hexuronate transporter
LSLGRVQSHFFAALARHFIFRGRNKCSKSFLQSRTTFRAVPPLNFSQYRWRICALLFFATTINYIDRQVIGLLKPTLMHDLHWDENAFANIQVAFQAAYAVGYAGGGWVIDRIGTRLGYAAAVLGWSLAAMGHTFARTALSFGVARSGLGLAEGGNFPAAIKTVSEWFPKKERALVTGIFNSGCNIAVMLTPLFVPPIAKRWGWPYAFLVTGALGLVWLVAWSVMYRNPQEHPRVSAAELALIQNDPPDPAVKLSWVELLRHRQTWAFTAGIVLVSPVWWFYLFWVPGFLHDKYGLNLNDFGKPLVTIYFIASFGSIAGGWLSSWLLKRGWSLNAARKTAMLACAVCVVPVFMAATTANLWLATILIGIAAAAHQGFSANLYTLVSDTAPRFAVSSIVGIGGAASAIAGMFAAKATGYVLEWTHSYVFLFGGASMAYLVAVLVMHLLNPRHEAMKLVVTTR